MMSSYEESGVTPTYFTCTLGEAAGINDPAHPKFKTINDLIDAQAKLYPNNFAVGFPVPKDEDQEWDSEVFSFKDLQEGTIGIAAELNILLRKESREESKTVALLCPSAVDFLFTWLGLIRAGFSVLLIAPQCQPEAIAHLCKSCEVSCLLYHEIYSDLASSASQTVGSDIKARLLPWQAQDMKVNDFFWKKEQGAGFAAQNTAFEAQVAYIHHTSGTSTGLPKPIPQTHHAAVGVLPRLDGQHPATFSTTPLYHGGIADCFRAWTSKAMIWLFPGTDTPITSKTILACLSVADRTTQIVKGSPKVKYFSSVPYILQMLSQNKSGLSVLRQMELVGVGGASLPDQIGDDLVQKGINLLSRFGSAECGFLLSSHRHYHLDKNWQYLRVPPDSKYLRFEGQIDGSGISELVIIKGWPHMAKSNRPDGSFVTSDMFEPHPTIVNAWRYHSRNDGQITLITGKKFDPAPVEDTIASGSLLVREVLVFGNGRQNPGVLVFRSEKAEDLTDDEFGNVAWEVVEGVNERGQDHTRISRDMMVVMPADSPALERSSKGTILRKVAEEAFVKEMDCCYGSEVNAVANNTGSELTDGKDMEMVVRSIVMEVVGHDSTPENDADFYRYGLNSTQCTQIRNLLQRKLGQDLDPLPWSFVYDCGNINRLANHISTMRSGRITNIVEESEFQQMLDLVEQFSTFNPVSPASCSRDTKASSPLVVVLTGATGALGAQILDILRNSSTISQIFCLVRAPDHKEARTRVSNGLIQRHKRSLDFPDEKVSCVPSSLGHSTLGISQELLTYFHQKVTHIIHAAWAVNFSLPLKSFVPDHLTGLHNLLNLAKSCSNPAQLVFCSSTASVFGRFSSAAIEEKISTSPEDSDSLGYSRSKWVAEAICSAASHEPSMNSRIKVLRIGQLTGDTEHGIWNMAEAFPLMLSTVDALSCLPSIDEKLTWLPLDVAAEAVVEIAFNNLESEDGKCPVYHVVKERTDKIWLNLLKWVKDDREERFEIVDVAVWLAKLEKLEDHPAKNLLWLWRKAYGAQKKEDSPEIRFSVERARQASEALRNAGDVDRILVGKIWDWLRGEMAGR